jgi:hypothetical protein
MKHKILLLTFTAALALGLAGCNKSETSTLSTDDAVSKTAEAAKAAEAVKAEAAKVEAARVEAAKVAAAKVAAAKAADNAKAQELIDKATSLVAESKFSDASSTLQQLTGLSLTSEQIKLVDTLKEQIQKALAARTVENAAGAAGGLLKQ